MSWSVSWGSSWGISWGDNAAPPPAGNHTCALSMAKLGIGFGAIAVASIGLLCSEPAAAVEPAEYHGGKSVSVEYVRDLWELQELRLKGRIEPASAPEIVTHVAPVDVVAVPLVADDEIVPPIALAIEPVQSSPLAADGNQIDADAAKAAHAAKLKRNKAALLLILANL